MGFNIEWPKVDIPTSIELITGTAQVQIRNDEGKEVPPPQQPNSEELKLTQIAPDALPNFTSVGLSSPQVQSAALETLNSTFATAPPPEEPKQENIPEGGFQLGTFSLQPPSPVILALIGGAFVLQYYVNTHK